MIRLTETVRKGGCAAKLPAGQLRSVLKSLPLQTPPQLKVGTDHLDDACVWDLGSSAANQQLIQTLDFFTPIVDEPADFGAIAAANAISDVYAMGGQPRIALSILAFPAQTLPVELIQPLLAGALEKIHEAGACLAGGHTIDDDTLKLGFSVTGFVAAGRAWTNTGARAGDRLILTKGLGTGTITTALKIGEAKQEWIDAAIASMKVLNRVPELIKDIDVRAATDITGFGLAGHALQMARGSGKRFELFLDRLPSIHGAMECLGPELEMLNRAHKTNLDYTSDSVTYDDRATAAQRWLCVDPQTSGGLLLSVACEQADLCLERIRKQFPLAAIIGTVHDSAPDGSETGRLHFGFSS